MGVQPYAARLDGQLDPVAVAGQVAAGNPARRGAVLLVVRGERADRRRRAMLEMLLPGRGW